MTVAGYFLPRHYHSECHKSEWGATLVCDCMCVCVCASARACCNVAETNRIAGGKSLFCLFVGVLRVRTRARAHLQTLYAQRGASFSLSLSLAFSLSLARSRALSLALSLSFSHTHTITHCTHSEEDAYSQRESELRKAVKNKK